MPSRDHEFEIRIDSDHPGPIARRLEELRALIETSHAGIAVGTERINELAEALRLAPQPGQIVRLPDVSELDERRHPDARVQRVWDEAGRLEDATQAAAELPPPGGEWPGRFVGAPVEIDDPPSRARPFRRGGTETGRWSNRAGRPLNLDTLRRAERDTRVRSMAPIRLPVEVEFGDEFDPRERTSLQCLCCWAGKRVFDVAQPCACRADKPPTFALAMHALAVQLTLLCKTCQQCQQHCQCATKPEPTGRKIVL